MNSLEKFELGRPSEGSTFSTTLHLLSPQLQEWIRRTPDKKQLRRFACACVRAFLPCCPRVPPPALLTLEFAERFCAEPGTDSQLDEAYALLGPVVKGAFEQVRSTQEALEAGRASLDDCLAAELAHRATVAARACVLRSAAVAAAETVFEHNNVLTRRKAHELHQSFLARAAQILDQGRLWFVEEQDELLQSYLKDLPRPFIQGLCAASDSALRRFACECAAAALEFARQVLEPVGLASQLEPLAAVVATSRQYAADQATAAELKGAYEAGLRIAGSWYRKEDELRDQQPGNHSAIQTAATIAEAADCVYPCAEGSSKLAAVKCLRVAMHVLRETDHSSTVNALAEKYLGPAPAAS